MKILEQLKKGLEINRTGYLVSLLVAWLGTNLVIAIQNNWSIINSLILIPICGVLLFVFEILFLLFFIIGGKGDEN